ncbi:unnamed protein product [Arctogadus glacialis]
MHRNIRHDMFCEVRDRSRSGYRPCDWSSLRRGGPLVLAVAPETPLQHYTPPSTQPVQPNPIGPRATPPPGGRTLRPPQHLPLRPAAPSQNEGLSDQRDRPPSPPPPTFSEFESKYPCSISVRCGAEPSGRTSSMGRG